MVWQGKRALVLVDGPNLRWSARRAWGYRCLNVDIRGLAETLCQRHGLELVQVRFYQGLAAASHAPVRRLREVRELADRRRQGVRIFAHEIYHGHEKGVDVHIALDAVRLSARGAFDAVVLLSVDRDFADLPSVASGASFAVAYLPDDESALCAVRGLGRFARMPITRAMYDAHLDVSRCRVAEDWRGVAVARGAER